MLISFCLKEVPSQVVEEKKAEDSAAGVDLEELRARIKEELCEEIKQKEDEGVTKVTSVDLEELRASLKEELRLEQEEKLKATVTKLVSPNKLVHSQVINVSM